LTGDDEGPIREHMGYEEDTKMIRADLDTWEKVKTAADMERRTMQAQLGIIVDAGMTALGFEFDKSGTTS
jgi:hypothetical protein